MNATLNTTAKLVFQGERFVSLPKVASILEAHLTEAGHDSVRQSEASLTGLCVEVREKRFLLEMAFEDGETVLSVGIEAPGAAPATKLADLAAALYPIARQIPAAFVIWAGTDLRIPRQAFVDGLAAQFGKSETQLDISENTKRPSADVTQIAPRRVAAQAGARTTRPLAGAASNPVANCLPAVDPAARLISANANVELGCNRYDAHVQAYEHNLRSSMLRLADQDEIEALRDEYGIVPLEARLSTWAVSLTIATVSLPVAAPVMIYNVARGEDMRVASLAMGLAGFFLALNSSGAMAGVTGF